MRVVVTAAAEADLVGIGRYIARDNWDRAVTVVEALLERCGSLADLPNRYPLVPRYEQWGIRRCLHGSYLIFYRVRSEQVEIEHILHGARDYESLLFSVP